MIHIIYPKNTVFYSIVLSGRSSIVDRALSFILDQISSFDHNVLASVNYFMRNRIMDAIMPYVTKLADNGVIWIALALILLIPKKTRRTGAAMGVALLIGLIVGNGLIKNLVARPRPFNIPDTVLSKNGLLIEPPTDYSFPSGHTLASFEAATALYKDHTVYGFMAFVLAFLIGFSRIYLQVHYPSDVIGGAILGFLFGLLGSTIVRSVCDRWNARKAKKQAEIPAEKDTSEDSSK